MHMNVLVIPREDVRHSEEIEWAIDRMMQGYKEDGAGCDDEYKEYVDETKVVLEEIEKRGLEAKDGMTLAEVVADWFGGYTVYDEGADVLAKMDYIVQDSDGKPVKAVRYTNPNGRWDYYGRMKGGIVLKSGRETDKARIGNANIDWNASFDKIFAIVDEGGWHDKYTWDERKEFNGIIDDEEKREAF